LYSSTTNLPISSVGFGEMSPILPVASFCMIHHVPAESSVERLRSIPAMRACSGARGAHAPLWMCMCASKKTGGWRSTSGHSPAGSETVPEPDL
jgi:hypothetical protein